MADRRTRPLHAGKADRAVAPDDPDRELDEALDAARTGDQDGFNVVYRDTQPRLVRYARTLVGQDAEDATAEAWLQIARDVRGFSGDIKAFRGWAVVVVRNRAFDLLRTAARRPSTPTGIEIPDRLGTDETADTAAELLSTEAALALIATLPRDQAEAVLLRAVVGVDATTAGLILGKRAGAVRVAAHRGLRTLARKLQQPDLETGLADEIFAVGKQERAV
jgi:RNA polymerase sigma-70 factor (ECF subfamily)